MEKPLKTILLNYINSQENWVTKGQLHLIAEQEGYSPEYAGRELRRMAELGLILKEEYKGKRSQTLVKYAKIDTPQPTKTIFKEINGTMYQMPEEIIKTFTNSKVESDIK